MILYRLLVDIADDKSDETPTQRQQSAAAVVAETLGRYDGLSVIATEVRSVHLVEAPPPVPPNRGTP